MLPYIEENNLYRSMDLNLPIWAPENRDFIIFVGIQAITQADLDALDRILDSFMVDVS